MFTSSCCTPDYFDDLQFIVPLILFVLSSYCAHDYFSVLWATVPLYYFPVFAVVFGEIGGTDVTDFFCAGVLSSRTWASATCPPWRLYRSCTCATASRCETWGCTTSTPCASCDAFPWLVKHTSCFLYLLFLYLILSLPLSVFQSFCRFASLSPFLDTFLSFLPLLISTLAVVEHLRCQKGIPMAQW